MAGTQTSKHTIAVESKADLTGIKATTKELADYGEMLRKIKTEMKELGQPDLANKAATQYLARMRAETRKAQQEQINAALDSATGKKTGLAEQLKGAFGKDSGLGGLGTMLTGGAIFLGLDLLGQKLAGLTTAWKDYRKAAAEASEADAPLARAKMAEGLPIVGSLVTAFKNLLDLSSQQEVRTEAITEAAAMQDQYARLKAEHLRAQNKQLEDQAALLRKIHNETQLAGMGGAAGAFTSKEQAIREEREQAARRVRDANLALNTYQTDSPETARARDIVRNLGGKGQLLKEQASQLAAARKLIAEDRKGREQAMRELENANEAEAEINKKAAKEESELQREFARVRAGLVAQEAADRLTAKGRAAEAELELLRESLRKQQEEYTHAQTNNASAQGLALQAQEISNTEQKLAEQEAAVGRERAVYQWEQGRREQELQAALEASKLKAAGDFAQAQIAQLKAAHQSKLEELDREEAEELRKNPEYAAAIQKRYAAERAAREQQLGQSSSAAALEQLQLAQRANDMQLDFGLRMAQRAKPSYTFEAQNMDAGSGGLSDLYKARESGARQFVDMLRINVDHTRQTRDFVQAILAKMLSFNVQGG